jgi:hypothetical protein
MKTNSSILKIHLIACGLIVALLMTPCDAPAQAQKKNQGRQLQQMPAPVKQWPVKAKRFALIIGVDDYEDTQITTLGGSTNDARTLVDALVRYAGFPADQVTLLASDQTTERQPTRGNILRRLSNLRGAVPQDGMLLVAFAGHGMERGGQAYLLPSDAQVSNDVRLLEETAINVTRMKEAIKETGVSQVVLILDACRNDPVGRANADNPLTQTYTRGFNFDIRNREVTAFATLYATAVGHRAYEFKEKRQGYFTWELVEALKGHAANEKGEVTLASLVKYLQEQVPKHVQIDLGKEQRPFAIIEGYKADELVIAVAGEASSTSPDTPSSTQAANLAAADTNMWELIKNSTNPQDFKNYLMGFPNGRYVEQAKRRLKNLEAQAKNSNNSAAPFTSPSEGSGETSNVAVPTRQKIDIITVTCNVYPYGGNTIDKYGASIGIGGYGWGAEEVKVIINGQDVSAYLTQQSEAVILLLGTVAQLNLHDGKNEVVLKVGENVSNPHAFRQPIK